MITRRTFVARIMAGVAAAQFLGVDVIDLRKRALGPKTPEPSTFTASIYVRAQTEAHPEYGLWERKVEVMREVEPGHFVAFEDQPYRIDWSPEGDEQIIGPGGMMMQIENSPGATPYVPPVAVGGISIVSGIRTPDEMRMIAENDPSLPTT